MQKLHLKSVLHLETVQQIEYSDNYSDTSGSLWKCQRDEQPKENSEELSDLSADNSSTFKYISNFTCILPNGGTKN